MNIGTVGPLSQFQYQLPTPLSTSSQNTNTSLDTTPVAASTSPFTSGSGTQDPAVLQALTAVYTSLASSANGFVDTTGTLSSLASSIYSLSGGSSAVSSSGLGAALSASMPSLLSTSQSSTSSNGLLAAVNMDATAALAAFSYRLNNPSATATVTAPTASASTTDGTQSTSLQSAIQAALAVSTNSSLSLLA